MPDKKCSKCGKVKDVGEFHKRKDSKDGLHSYCKECSNQYNSQRYINNREKILQQVKQYHVEHREEKLKYDKQYHVEHREELLQYKVDYYIKNQNRHNEISSKNYYNNKYPHLKGFHRKKNDTKLTIV